MAQQKHDAVMKNGTPYILHPCIDEDELYSRQRLREEIRASLKSLSSQSLWQRFAAPVTELSEEELDYLTNLDGRNRVAWAAVAAENGVLKGLGLARYFHLKEAPGVAEFAVTVIDEFQGQGIGTALLERLLETARENSIKWLRGYILPGNRAMLAICERRHASLTTEDSFIRADIEVPE